MSKRKIFRQLANRIVAAERCRATNSRNTFYSSRLGIFRLAEIRLNGAMIMPRLSVVLGTEPVVIVIHLKTGSIPLK